MIKYIPLTLGNVAKVDAKDYDQLMQFQWHTYRSKRSQRQYAVRSLQGKAGVEHFWMHRQILNVNEPKIEVDHKDLDGLNNTRDNLRIATHQENQHNRPMQTNNTSGYKGVHFHKKTQKWTAQIRFNGALIHLGSFTSPERAALAYNVAAQKYHGEFARLNEIGSKPPLSLSGLG